MARAIRHRGKWRIRWIDASGKRRSEVYADHRTAEHALRRRQVEAEEIRRGIRLPDPESHTFGELFDYWVEHRAPRKRSGRDDESIIRAHLRPSFADLQLSALNVEHIDRFVNARAHLAKQTVRNILTLLTTMLNLAQRLGWLRTVPRIEKPRVRLFAQDYRWLRDEHEIRRFLEAAHPEGDLVFALYCTAIYAGMREGELAALPWTDVDFTRRLIAVQRSFDGPTKAEDLRHVPILDPLLPVLEHWRLRNPFPLVFPNAAGEIFDDSARVFQETLHRVLDRAGFPKIQHHGKLRPYVGFHCLRHTFASHWVLRGGDLFKLQKILGHKSIAMTQRYAHLAPAAFKDDLGRLGSCAPGADAKVLTMLGRSSRGKRGARANHR